MLTKGKERKRDSGVETTKCESNQEELPIDLEC